MGVFDDIEQCLAKVTYGDVDVLGAEPIAYTPTVGGRPGSGISLNVVVDRSEPLVAVGEASAGVLVRQVRFLLPRDPDGITGSPSCNREDLVMVPWKVGDSPARFRIKQINASDAGGWQVVAEASRT